MNNNCYGSLINIKHLSCGDFKSSINLKFLQDLFYHLSKTEEYFYKNIYSIYKNPNKKHYKDIYDMDLSYSNVHFYKTDIINYNKPGYKQRYYKFYGVKDVDLACEQYISGLYWILGYYQNHIHNNWSWYYPYHAVPFASDIFNYLKQNQQQGTSDRQGTVIEKGIEKSIEKSIEKCIVNLECLNPSRALTTREQLIMVLPKESLLEIMHSKDLDFHDKLCRFFNTKSQQLQDYYPEKLYLDMIHKEYLWQSKIFLKTFNNEIINILM